MYTSLSLDSKNSPHISYCDLLGIGNLKYARWNGISWSTSIIDSAGNVGAYTSIAIDKKDNPHISYYDGTNGDLKYAKWAGTYWSTTTIDSSGDVGLYTSIALDVNNNPHISYYDATNHSLKYAKWAGTWSIMTIDSSGVYGYTSIALDTDNNPHISYHYHYSLSKAYYLLYAKWTPTVTDQRTISGKVTKSDGSTAIGSAIVELCVSGIVKSSTTTDANGTYQLINISTGVYDVRASATGYVTQTKTGQVVTANQTTTVNFALLETAEQKAQPEYKTTIGENLFSPQKGGTAKVGFSVPATGKVTIKIYDLTGTEIKTLLEEYKPSGEYQIDWNGKNFDGDLLPPGIYFLYYEYPGGKEVIFLSYCNNNFRDLCFVL
ncbi:MAG: carboxypeptidase regulatory-like domain-containing protein, partial [Elusimicrobiota bacterium]